MCVAAAVVTAVTGGPRGGCGCGAWEQRLGLP
ncbi:hypothetical protein E2C01_081525 [Portunus trituberculatus]|uniref:Uncharacterized protein n=1 Tax=Portunus trituberculatus TaxID=210409 RepID=A0A5B7IWW0_PORTR|nr:hypothetical protein [Portunus trituberculatus]